MTNNALQTIQQYQQSISSGNDEWKELLADDITFNGPAVGVVRGKNAIIELNVGFFPLVRNYEPISSFGQGNQAMLEGVFTVAAPSGKEISFNLAEVYDVENGKIQNIRLYYDAEEFRKEFSQ